MYYHNNKKNYIINDITIINNNAMTYLLEVKIYNFNYKITYSLFPIQSYSIKGIS